MEWQAVVLAVQILLLAAGWLLFQRARGELSARAAETPVLAEVRALQKSVKQLLVEIEAAADRQSQRLESGCTDAAAILVQIEERTRDAERRMEQFEERMRALDSRRAHTVESSGELTGLARRRSAGERARGAGEYAGNHRADTSEPAIPIAAEAFSAVQIAANRRESVFRLADSGESPASIARATRLSEGEIETLLSLRTQR